MLDLDDFDENIHGIINPWNVVLSLQSCFADSDKHATDATPGERELGFTLYRLIADKIEGDVQVAIQHDQRLVLPDDHDSTSINDNDYAIPVSDTADTCATVSISIQYKNAVDYWRNKGGKQRSFSSVQHRFKKLKRPDELYRWETQVESGGTKVEKLQFITKETLKDFKSARIENKKNVNDVHIKKWALKNARRVGDTTFRASRFWIQKFKKVFRIVSRKVTKFVTKKQRTDELALAANATIFVGDVSELIKIHGPERVLNTDQAGFNQEFHAGRTLDSKGVKQIFSEAQSINSLTHSYSIQPIISADGRLLPELLVVLKENDGRFGPKVQKTLFKCDNLYVLPSKSGKLTKEIVQAWLKDVYIPSVPELSVLLLDSWSAQTEDNILTWKPEAKNVVVKTIPKGTTGMVQPLDVFGFRIWKQFVRFFYDLVLLHDFDVNIHLRNNLLKIQCIVHNQLSSPRFVNMWKYSWFKCGYVDTRPEKFVNPVEFCFKDNSMEDICNVCDEESIARCAWCTLLLCKSLLCKRSLLQRIHIMNEKPNYR